jgi:tRNA pseudouridine38-40 synthase
LLSFKPTQRIVISTGGGAFVAVVERPPHFVFAVVLAVACYLYPLHPAVRDTVRTSMSLWKLILTYDGTPFNGWQVQPNLPTVQGTLAHAIHHITGESVLPQGSGRTDTGVHALAQVASFSLNVPIPAPNLHRALNRALPPSIRVLSVEQAPEGFHARHSARRKTYEYRISTAGICSPMLAPYVWSYHLPLAFDVLQNAAAHILGTHDFTSFSASDPDLATRTEQQADTDPLSLPPTPCLIRTIHHSSWLQHEDLLIYRITGSGFLHHMVRNLVGTFVEAGIGRISADAIPTILAARNRSAAGPTAPAQGLFLVEVEY